MKLYKFDINDLIVEVEVIKETPTTYKYMENSSTQRTVKKENVDVALEYRSLYSLKNMIATSKEKLIKIAAESINAKIKHNELHTKALKLKKKRLLDRL